MCDYDRGHVLARKQLAISYECGASGVKKDLIRSYLWYVLTGPEESSAVERSERIRENLMPRELAEAEQLLSDWEPGQCERLLDVPLSPSRAADR